MRATNANTHLPPALERVRAPRNDLSAAPAVLLACGNPLRQDDGVGWRIAETVERMADRGFPESRLQIIAVQQWTPELAEHLAGAELAIFVDASAVDEPGAIRVREVSSPTSVKAEQSGSTRFRLAQARTWGRRAEVSETHGLEPAELMALAERVCGHAPARAFVLTVGGEWFQYGEEISRRVQQSVPRAVRLVGNLVAAFAEAA